MVVSDADLDVIFGSDRAKSADKIVETAQNLGQRLQSGGATTSQIRVIFGALRRIQLSFKQDRDKARRDLRLLAPKLAYQAGRHPNVKVLTEIVVHSIKRVSTSQGDEAQSYQNLMDFVEAVLAYYVAAEAQNRGNRNG